MGSPLDAALAYAANGFSVIPIRLDGSKAAAVDWKEWQCRCASEEVCSNWWGKPHPPGVALVCGGVSGGLEVIDFDHEAGTIYPAWQALVDEGWPGLLSRVSIVTTPRGKHVWLRCDEVATPGNQKLARDGGTVLIETRGEGGYALVPGCPRGCHPQRGVYEAAGGVALEALGSLFSDERDFLIACARSFDRTCAQAEPIPKSAPGNDLRPGDDFDRNGWDWGELLGKYGWALASTSQGGERRWRRPGKSKGWSATTGHCRGQDGNDLLRVFSSNADPFEEGKAYGKFRAFALLECNGNLTQAAQFLKHHGGFGSPVFTSKKKAAPILEPTEATEEEESLEVATIADLARAGAEVSWLWEGWLPRGVLVAIAAEGGTGKTRFCADLVRRVRHGMGWPDGMPIDLPRESKALWVVSDNHHDEMVTLCRSFDIEESVLVNAWKGDPYGGVNLEEACDFRDLELRVQKIRPAFVVVDTVGNATDRNLSRQEDARAFYQPLQVIARRNKVCILCLTHLNAAGKFLGRRVLEKVRVALRMDKPDPKDARRALEVVKTNSKKPASLGVTMGDGGNEYDDSPPIAPEPSEPGMAGYASGRSGAGRPPVACDACTTWLRDRLAEGAVRVSVLRDEAERLGHSTGSLYRTRSVLGIVEAEVQGKKWWSLPGD